MAKVILFPEAVVVVREVFHHPGWGMQEAWGRRRKHNIKSELSWLMWMPVVKAVRFINEEAVRVCVCVCVV